MAEPAEVDLNPRPAPAEDAGEPPLLIVPGEAQNAENDDVDEDAGQPENPLEERDG